MTQYRLNHAFLCNFATAIGYILLSACAAFFTSMPVIAENQTDLNQSQTYEKLPERRFSADSLYSLLVAEIAGSRKQYEVALTNYVQQAKQTHDPQVAARATMIARYLNDSAIALEMSLLWLDAAPKDKDALSNTCLALIQANRLQEAFDISKRIHAQDGEPLFQNIAASAGTLTQAQRERLLQNYKLLLPHYDRDEQLLVGIALLLQQQQKFGESMVYVRKALAIYPRSIPASVLEANLLHELKFDREAINKMSALLTTYPDNTSLRIQYAKILTHYDMALAQQQFTILSTQLPNNTDITVSLGIVAMERKDFKTASKAFEKLLNSDQQISTAHFYLGRIAEIQKDISDAIVNYLQVEPGNDFLAATISLLDIFIRKGDFLSAEQHMARVRMRFPDQSESLYLLHSQALIKYNALNEAETLLNEALQTNANSKLLFARAMLHSKRQQNAEAERDLRHIVQLEPNNAVALNSLGYLLTNTSQRFPEAEALLNKALELKPNDPVIIDSLGWLYFHMNKLADALRVLAQAYTNYPSAAVAAHYGEVLWVTGSQLEARKVWQEGIKLAPDDDAIPLTIKRLKAE